MTLKFGIIGKSLMHSWSKTYFQQKFISELAGDYIYENFPLENLSGFREMILKDKTLAGLNITIPYKIAVLDYMDELDPCAEITGAVNCIKISRSGNSIYLKGFNTDVEAFRRTLKPLLQKNDRNALVLGTGGGARAVCQALKQLNIEYTMVSREQKPGFLQYDQLSHKISGSCRLIINATPIGMFPEIMHCPAIPYQYLTDDHLLYDLIYNPAETLFLKNGKEKGARIKNGLEMLEVQADLSWEIWKE